MTTPMQKEVNILLLGETGVGKFTFINALYNYLKYDTLNEALSGNMDILIPSKFTVTEENYEEYQFDLGDVIVRFIDSPGIGYTRGIGKDKENFENILKCISDTLPALKEQLRKLQQKSGVEIKTNKETMYCFDNESFRFLAASNNAENRIHLAKPLAGIEQLIQTNIKLVKDRQKEIDNNGTCQVCGCHYGKHMQLTYDFYYEPVKVIDKT
ncbi:10543_t:CDS:2, partial [Gigaspora rosea]